MKKVLLSVLSLITYAIILAPVSYAAGTASTIVCQPIYGGGQSCVQAGNVLINKMVANPKTGSFVDNLSINSDKFAPDQQITFQITVTNTGSAMIPKITVKDVLPNSVSFVAGPGNFDNNTKTLSFEVANLNPNETRNFTVTGKVISSDKMPSDRTVVCEVNQAIAVINDITGQDNAEFCIEKKAVTPTTTKGGLKVFPTPAVTVTPPTGPEMLPLIGLLPTGIFGFFLRRKSITR